MSKTITHAFANSLVAVVFAKVHPNETAYILAGVAAASLVDLDHVVMAVKNRRQFQKIGLLDNLHLARSILHELFGLLVMGILAAFVYTLDPRLACVVFIAFILHLVQDWLLGISFPFNPVNNTEVSFFHLTGKQKTVIELLLLVFSGVLWLIYLSGHL